MFSSPNNGQFSKQLVLFHYWQLGTPKGQERTNHGLIPGVWKGG
jgi:hypothetical protein